MREIKFRGKRISDNKWVYGYFLINDNGSTCIYDPEIGDMPVIPETVGQSIGKNDKNGKEIYEGDKMKTHTGWITVIRWDEKELLYRGFMPIWEIIGNSNIIPLGGQK